MKKLIFLLSALIIVMTAEAKKVRFSVDMTGQIVSSNGVHITGDFQVDAGLGPNWDPGTAPMSQVGNTSVYSIVVNIPAFKKYEYRILNGNQTYDSEFVPEESRVGYDMVDNRWIYVDSLANDTTFVGAILFGGNAPSGKTLIRYKVDMSLAGAIPLSGVHVGTSYQSTAFNPQTTRLYSFGNGVYEIINYVTNSNYSFIYFNGNTAGTTETVPGSCATAGKRTITVTKDTVLAQVCFSSCIACIGVGLKENALQNANLDLYPNPASNYLVINSRAEGVYKYIVLDLFGKEIITGNLTAANQTIDVSNLESGLYFIYAETASGKKSSSKFVIE